MPPRGESMISRVVRVLEAFKCADGSLTASEIARQTGIPVPSAHRIVTELDDLGVLDRDPDRRVRIGMRLWEIVARSPGILTLQVIARPFLEDLRAVVNAPTLLSVLNHNDVLNVDTLSPRPPSAVNVTQPGVRLPVLASSPGIALVAFAQPQVRDHILDTARITRFTEHTVTDRGELRQIVRDTRRLGHVIARRWLSPDAAGVAVPILTDDDTAFAALSVTVPFATGTPSDLLPALRTTARGISRAFLAGNRPADPRVALLMRQIRHATELR